MSSAFAFVGNTRLVLESVGTADAAALRAIRQLVNGPIQEVARLVYQAPSELTNRLHPDAAPEVVELLGKLGFRVSVSSSDATFSPGVGEYEVALVVTDIARVPLAIAETAAFLGTDLPTARRLVCRSPAVLVSNVSSATVEAIRHRFGRHGVAVDVSRSSCASYYAVIPAENAGLRRVIRELVLTIASAVSIVETNEALTAADLTFADAQAIFERLRRTGARAAILNRDLERYDVVLEAAADTPGIRSLLESRGMPARVVPRVLGALPVVIQRNVGQTEVQALLDRVAAEGGRATGLSHSFQRFALVVGSVPSADEAIAALVSIGDLDEAEARSAVKRSGGRVGSFTRTTALWLQHVLTRHGANVEIELL